MSSQCKTHPRYPQWWRGSLLTAEQPRPWAVGYAAHAIALASSRETFIAAVAARAWRWAVQGIEHLSKPHEPRNAQELEAYARSIERSMPSLAAELRCLACKDG
jgi:hypothetical protein